MNTKEKLEIDLITKQLEYCGKSYDEVILNPSWKSTNMINQGDYDEWMEWGVNRMVESLGINRRNAEIEMSWFAAQNSVIVSD